MRSERATERRGELASTGASDGWETWRLYGLGRISHISPICYQRPAFKISSRRAVTTQDTPTPRNAHTPIRPYGLPDGEAAGEFCSDGVAAGLVSSFVAAVGDGTGVGVSAGVADASGVADVTGVADI